MSRTNLNSSTTLVLSHITYAYPGSAMPALDNVSATFATGWHGIVGDNGCGKSTFVRIACGLLIPDRGVVSPRLVSAYCAQEAGVEPPMLFDFACDFAPATTHLRRMLRITDDMLWRFSELSGGEQKKIQIAVALWQNPDLLAMDEPTNHVDAEGRFAKHSPSTRVLASSSRTTVRCSTPWQRTACALSRGTSPCAPATTPKLARRRIWSAKARRGPNRLRDPKKSA